MKLNFIFDKLIKGLIYSLIIGSMIFQNNVSDLKASPMNQNKDLLIIEELRLNVPAKYKKAWLKAEKQIWEPWLAQQDGFLGRQIFYNEEKEEALLLVKWKNKKLWKNIAIEEVNRVQNIFDENIKETLNLSKNPFELSYEGELFNQK
tara:strand:- start:81 stop:524 length:444 start_codon:yes stop_codon:yes gene_type:complete